jgi:hypothetical protein
MSGNCCPSCGGLAPNPVQGPNNSVPLKPGARPPTALVRVPDFRPTLTAVRDTDVHTAMARGLAEYLSQQSIEIGGRKLQLTTFSTWAEPEQNVSYPAAGVGAGSGKYDRSFTPSIVSTIDKNLRLLAYSEFSQELTVELWATDPKERVYLVAMIEEALNPVDWMYGCRLHLPFYHGTTATYELTRSQYTDTAEDAMRKYRKATFSISASVQALRLLSLPTAQPRLRMDGVGPDVVLTSTN